MNPQFKTYMIGQLVQEIEFSPESRKLIVQTGDNKEARAALYKEGEEQYQYSQAEVNEFIAQIIMEEVILSSTIHQEISIKPVDIKLGQHIKLHYQGTSGKIEEELLKIGKNEFLLIQHDRDSLMPGTILNSRSSPWEQGFEISFDFNRDNRSAIYRTGKLLNIELLGPNNIYRAIEEKEAISSTLNDDTLAKQTPDRKMVNNTLFVAEIKETSFFYPRNENPVILDAQLFCRMRDKDSLFAIRIEDEVLYMRLLELEQKEMMALFLRKNDILKPAFNIQVEPALSIQVKPALNTQVKDIFSIQQIQTITSAKFEQRDGKWYLTKKGSLVFKIA